MKLLDEREQEDLFVWPEYESKSGDDTPHAPVSAFAEEVRSKVNLKNSNFYFVDLKGEWQ